MGKFKKMVFGILSILIVFIISACSTESNDEDVKEEAGSAGEKYTINIAYGNQPGEPIDKLANKWKELAEEKSDKQLELKLYPSSQLGSEKDVVEQAVMGNNVVVLSGYDFLMDYVPDVGILNGPYLVEDMDDLIYLTTTEWFDGIRNDLRNAKIELITANTVYGERQLMTNKKVTNPKDLKGLKIRVPNNQMSIKTFEAMGAAATPAPLADLYTSLQQGLIDGAENPLPVLQGVKTQEVSKNVALTGHQKFLVPWIAGTEFIETIPEDLVKILKETGEEANEFGKGLIDEETASVRKEFEDAGVKFHEVDINPFKEKVVGVYKEFPAWTPGLYDTIQELLKNRE